MRRTLLLMAACILYTGLYAQSATKYSNEFLQLGVGARALALGGSVVASSNDVYCGYWNPAGLSKIEHSQVSLMHASYFAGIANYDYGSWASRTGDNGAIGISLIRFGVDGIANTFDLVRNGEIDYTRVTSFNATDFAAMVSYARDEKLKKFRHMDFSWGGNAKYIRRKIGPFAKSTGFGFDVSAKLEDKDNEWAIGIVIRDVTSTFNSWKYSFTEQQKDILAITGNNIPKNTLEITLPRIIGGICKTWRFDKISAMGEFDLSTTLDGKRNTLIKTNLFSMDPYLGVELGYDLSETNKIHLRTGLNSIQHYTNRYGDRILALTPNIGVGLKFGRFSIDYALTNLNAVAGRSPSLYSNIFSLKLDIQKE